MGSRRSRQTKNWPEGLYGREKGGKTYFSYRDPKTGKEIAIGNDLKAAITAVSLLNRRRAPDAVQQIVAKIERPESTIAQHVDWFLDVYLKGRRRKNGDELAQGTIDNHKLTLNRVKARWGSRRVDEPTRVEVVELIETWPPETGNRARSHLIKFFQQAQARGLRDDNPAEGTSKRDVVAQRDRLTHEQYKKIYAHIATPDWLRRAMRLELLSLQRPSDLCSGKRDDWADQIWSFRQSKSRGHGYGLLRIKPHAELAAAIEDCIAHQVEDCPYLLSYKPIRRRKSKDRDDPYQLSEQILSRAFAEARDLACGELPGVPPSFYEIKALGARLYEEAGRSLPWVQALMGHQDEKTTRIYTDRHREKWIEVVC